MVLIIVASFTYAKNNDGFHISALAGYQFPPDPIGNDYSSEIVYGGEVSYSFGKIEIVSDYIYFTSDSATPYSQTPTNMTIHHILTGANYNILNDTWVLQIGGGVAYSSLKETLETVGSFSDSTVGYYLSSGIKKPIGNIIIGLKVIYSSTDIEGNNSGGFFSLISIGL